MSGLKLQSFCFDFLRGKETEALLPCGHTAPHAYCHSYHELAVFKSSLRHALEHGNITFAAAWGQFLKPKVITTNPINKLLFHNRLLLFVNFLFQFPDKRECSVVFCVIESVTNNKNWFNFKTNEFQWKGFSIHFQTLCFH